MMRIVTIRKLIGPRAGLLLFFVCLTGATNALAAADMTAHVDRDVASRGDQVLLTITVTGDNRNLPAPDLPEIPGVVASRGGSSQSFQMINGAVSTSVTWTYYLRIETDDDVTIPGLEVMLDGHRLHSEAITIRVESGASRSRASSSPADRSTSTARRDQTVAQGPGDDHFVTLTLDRETAYVGEQVVLVFRYYANPFARGLDRPQYTPPRAEGFWRE